MEEDSTRRTRYQRYPSLIASDIEECLDEVQSIGTFATSVTTEQAMNPGLTIEDVGTLGLPLSEREASVVIDASRRAPFGKGSDTIVDETVRKTWEIDAAKLSFKNPKWEKFVSTAVDTAAEDLGVKDVVRGELYKLLLYEEGAMFKPHRDTEKVPGMFGTLVISLPSKHEGGELCLTHGKQVKTFKTADKSDFDLSILAWYADVIHEVKPVTSGYRLVLTYNLVKEHTFSEELPTAANIDNRGENLQTIFRAWNVEVAANRETPKFLCYLLEHDYTDSSLCWRNLKATDQRRAQLVAEACKDTRFHVFLTNLEREVTNSIVEDYPFHYDHECDDEEDEDEEDEEEKDAEIEDNIVEEINRSLKLHHVVDLNGSLKLTSAEIAEDDIVQNEPFAGRDPDDTEEEYTGNEGATSTHWYRNSALLLLPHAEYISFFLKNKLKCGIEAKTDIDTLREKLQRGASDEQSLRDDLVIACRVVLSKDAAPRAAAYDWLHMRNTRPTSEILGSIAHSSVILSDKDLLQLCINQAGDGLTVSSFWEMGRAMTLETWPSMQTCIENAVKKFSKISPRMEAVHQFRKGFQESEVSSLNQCRDDAVGQVPDVDLAVWSTRVAGEALNVAPFGVEDGRALVQAAIRYGENMLCNQITPFVQRNISSSQFAVTFLVELLRSEQRGSSLTSRASMQLSNDTVNNTFDFLFSKVATHFNPHWFHKEVQGQQQNSTFRPPPVHEVTQPVKESDDAERIACLYGNATTRKLFDAAQSLLENILANLSTIAVEDFEPIWLPFLRHLTITLSNVSQTFSEPSVQSIFCEILTAYLERMVKMQPPRPADWARATSPCSCSDCHALNTFLANPGQEVGTFPMAEKRRSHLQGKLDYTPIQGQSNHIVRHGSPYTLVVTKDLKHWEKDRNAWQRRVERARRVFSQFDAAILNQILGSKYDDIILMRMIKGPVSTANGRARPTHGQGGPLQGQLPSPWSQRGAPPLQELPVIRQNQQQLPNVNRLPGVSNIPQKRKADIVDLTDD
ncbi:hypothetical protein EV356DRAFT_569412 [Viridothelium virens]|uniref:Prolyl 4-hydroxylase alpha subunit Fe(2+) 2OG dioxygenase domain-containing protein n=1 Tax=Viridothelium virens TaxID=1048519 RepID=A0A6A6H279_VIRVR|nr:hypothetical protein EV356DRAFT_569412 [Viridothelium virens]